jgi:thymidine kinase
MAGQGVDVAMLVKTRSRRDAMRRALKLGYARLEVFCGPMKSGKSAALIGRLAQYQYASLSIQVFFPSTDVRGPGDAISSRLGISLEALRVSSAADLLEAVAADCDVVAIDEVQLFPDPGAVAGAVRELIERGVVVLAAGLDLDYAGRPFGAVAELCALADRVEKLTAICARCGSAFATRTQRLVDGEPARAGGPTVLIEGATADVTYEARCHWCYRPPR